MGGYSIFFSRSVSIEDPIDLTVDVVGKSPSAHPDGAYHLVCKFGGLIILLPHGNIRTNLRLPQGNMRAGYRGVGMEKNRRATEETLLQAVGAIVEEKGFAGLGVNAVAEKAEVSKMLIYRYFGDLQGLIKAWALEKSYWVEDTAGLEEELACLPGDIRIYREALKDMFRAQGERLREEPLRRELLRWFIAEENPVSREAMDRIEIRGREITRSFLERIETDEDIDAVIALLIGGSYYLSLIADRVEVFNGVPLGTAEGQRRLQNAMDGILERIPMEMKEKKDEE